MRSLVVDCYVVGVETLEYKETSDETSEYKETSGGVQLQTDFGILKHHHVCRASDDCAWTVHENLFVHGWAGSSGTWWKCCALFID